MICKKCGGSECEEDRCRSERYNPNIEPTWCKYVKVNGNEHYFDISDDGITWNPLYGGDGTEKDVDVFLTWEEIVKIFKEEKQARNN
jgi:hypothetical protein